MNQLQRKQTELSQTQSEKWLEYISEVRTPEKEVRYALHVVIITKDDKGSHYPDLCEGVREGISYYSKISLRRNYLVHWLRTIVER